MPPRSKRSTTVDDITAHFASTYISGNGRLAAFQKLCADLRVDVGTSITQCKKVKTSHKTNTLYTHPNHVIQNIKSANVNIRDFVRVQQAGGDVSTIKYKTFRALRSDMQVNPERRFPIRRAKADELIAAMLINI